MRHRLADVRFEDGVVVVGREITQEVGSIRFLDVEKEKRREVVAEN